MGITRRTLTLRDLIGLIKDKASLSKAAILSTSPTAANLRLAVLRATTHSPSTDDETHLDALLLLGDGSRATASSLIAALMDRLHRTRNCTVALKCLIIIHHIVKRGTFILQDQLSIFPATGGYNYLKLSAFRDGATASTWFLSGWVRWYARYLETLLSTSRILGYFLCSDSSIVPKENRVPSLLNFDLIKEMDSLIMLMDELGKVPIGEIDDQLVKEIMILLCYDYVSLIGEILLRVGEIKERLSLLSFGDSVELICGLNRLRDSKEKLSEAYGIVKKPSIAVLWSSVQDLSDKLGMLKVEGGKLVSLGRRDKISESARFEHRVVKRVDSVRFQSGRFGMNSKLSNFLVVE